NMIAWPDPISHQWPRGSFFSLSQTVSIIFVLSIIRAAYMIILDLHDLVVDSEVPVALMDEGDSFNLALKLDKHALDLRFDH
ncbi:MAG: hypothetical protein KAU38_08560, partial [Desulfobacterales bacterium]|nr:hypothetical protein [Desulfobacterales bacterium]